MTVIDVSNAVQDMMQALGISGSFDVRHEGSRSTGWVGKPGGEDFEVIVAVKSLPPTLRQQC